MKIDFTKQLFDLEGDPAFYEDNEIPLNASDILRRNLLQNLAQNEGDVLKAFDWAMELKEKGSLDLDKSDQTKLTKIVAEIPGLPVLYKGQILNIIRDGKEKS